MSILTLPPELLAAIIGHLDTTSVHNLYAAGVACIQGLVTECHFSANTLATANSLRTDFFTGVLGYLKVLNLSGVPDLDAPCLLGALVNMNSLVDLDVSYTNINMADFLEIAAARPTMKSIAIDFTFERKKLDIMDEVLLRIKNTALPEYQHALKRFENVHFVGRLGSRVHGALALLMLQSAELNNLTFTASGAGEGSQLDVSAWRVPMVNTAQFQLYSLKTPRRMSLLETPIYTVMDFKKYEVIIFCVYYKSYRDNESNSQKVFATPVLKKIICEHFGGGVAIASLPDPLCLAALRASLPLAAATLRLGTDSACLFWDVDRTKFDSAFRSKLLKIVKEYYVFEVDASATPVPAEHDWCRVTADPRNTLDYNAKFHEKQKVKLKIIFNKKLRENTMPKIDRDRDFLKKVTHLSLSGAVTDPIFQAYFKALFESCSSLETLQVSPVRRDITFLQHLKEAKRLRNILVYLFCPKQTCRLLTYLSQCESLENIYLYGSSPTYLYASLERLPELVPLLSKLSNVYNFCMNVSVAASDAELSDTCKRVTSELGRDALRVVLSRDLKVSPYHPYLSVFNLVYRLNPNSTHGCNVSKILNNR